MSAKKEYDIDIPLSELTDKQLIEMSEEEVQRRIKLAMARNGIPFLEKPVEPDEPDGVEPDGKFYETALLDGYLFENPGDPGEVLALMSKMRVYKKKVEYGEPSRYTEDLFYRSSYKGRGLTVSPVEVLSESQWQESKEVTMEYKKKKEKYDRELSLYNENEKKIQRIRDSIIDPICEARYREVARSEAGRIFDEYLKIAKWDHGVAMGFYVKAYSPEPFIVDFLNEKHGWT